MKLSESVRSISYLRTHTAAMVREARDTGATYVITQNGEAKAVVQDIAAYEATQESVALLKLLAQSQRSVRKGRHKALRRAFGDVGRALRAQA